jgi:hypothetical protein
MILTTALTLLCVSVCFNIWLARLLHKSKKSRQLFEGVNKVWQGAFHKVSEDLTESNRAAERYSKYTQFILKEAISDMRDTLELMEYKYETEVK